MHVNACPVRGAAVAKPNHARCCWCGCHARSFVDDVGVVPHAPVSTLSFPLCNDPQNQKEFQRRNFSAQVDERMLAGGAAPPAMQDPRQHTAGAAPGAAAAADSDAKALPAACKSLDVEGGARPTAALSGRVTCCDVQVTQSPTHPPTHPCHDTQAQPTAAAGPCAPHPVATCS